MYMKRTLTITTGQTWQDALRNAGHHAKTAADTGHYQGESLNFESPATFFGQLTDRRGHMGRVMMGSRPVGVREWARRVERDVKRVREDAQVLVTLGLREKSNTGALHCPFDDSHVDMHLSAGLEA